MAKRKFEPVHPGVVPGADFLHDMGIRQYRLAKSIGMPARRINEIIGRVARPSIRPGPCTRPSRPVGDGVICRPKPVIATRSVDVSPLAT